MQNEPVEEGSNKTFNRANTLEKEKGCNFDDEFNDTIEMIDSPLSSTRAIKINCHARSDKDKEKANEIKTRPISFQNTNGALSEKISKEDDSDEEDQNDNQLLK